MFSAAWDYIQQNSDDISRLHQEVEDPEAGHRGQEEASGNISAVNLDICNQILHLTKMALQ